MPSLLHVNRLDRVHPFWYAWPAVLVLTLFVVSCGSSGPRLYPVRGKILFQNAPAEGAVVVLHPLEPKAGTALTPSGTAGPDGTFTLTTHPHGEGAPAGEYRVLITWFPPNAREVEKPMNKLPAKYSAADSPLRATIAEGPTELKPFALTR